MGKLPYILSILLAGVVSAQTIYVTDQNIFDLNPSRDALSGLAGSQRIRANFWVDPSFTNELDVTAGLPIELNIISQVDDYIVTALNTATSSPPNSVWWDIPFVNAGSYRLQATINLPGDSFPVFDRFLTLTNVPDVAAQVTANVNITNVISSTLIINANGTTVAEIVQP